MTEIVEKQPIEVNQTNNEDQLKQKNTNNLQDEEKQPNLPIAPKQRRIKDVVRITGRNFRTNPNSFTFFTIHPGFLLILV